ncbi:hypothetical protein SAMN05421823_102537 [Catalinimonas alkaloidigena]|uniref:Uncharacterized protein n=1 Tax=Catalinimonas alkaloidigena TaxID=1075417 RepID=A0A1G9B8I8_9BACT|nr:hypothetical protein [Catalinimonas alkaloidigena]SDK35444.1 hypothetical protein SAMN05421823_102537 [Catalinimonas alkaloidigena]
MKPTTGNIALVHNPLRWWKPMTWLYAGIRRITRSEWNHCVIFCELEGQLFVCEALGKGFFPYPYEQWLERAPDRRTRLLPWTCDVSEITPHFGKKYDYWGTFVAQLLFRIGGWWIGPVETRATRLLACAEAVATIYQLPNPWQWAPCDFLAYESIENERPRVSSTKTHLKSERA